MGCTENVCTNRHCKYHQISNDRIEKCPVCGHKVLNYFDEQLDYEHDRCIEKYGEEEEGEIGE